MLFRLKPGDTFVSKWNGKPIAVIEWLGEGANGSVYLAHIPDGPSHCALKIGSDAYALQSEINALQAVGRHAPKLLLADDGEVGGKSFPFYAMSFVPGVPLNKTKLAGHKIPAAVIGERLLFQLKELHAAGWAFGDLKPGNVMVSGNGEVRLIDYGGATLFGQSVKQFTELYDRGFWRAGGRKADAAYDLFAFAVVMLETFGADHRLREVAQSPLPKSVSTLVKLADECRLLTPVTSVLKRMLRSEFRSTEDAYLAWKDAGMRSDDARGVNFTRESWPALWFAGALLTFAAVVWRMFGM